MLCDTKTEGDCRLDNRIYQPDFHDCQSGSHDVHGIYTLYGPHSNHELRIDNRCLNRDEFLRFDGHGGQHRYRAKDLNIRVDAGPLHIHSDCCVPLSLYSFPPNTRFKFVCAFADYRFYPKHGFTHHNLHYRYRREYIT